MSTRKLLLADDSVTIQKVVNLTFADEGIEVISVGNGDAAMEKMAEVMPDLVMADVNMPGLTGYQVCERIRQNENLNNTPVILLVGSFEHFDEEEARRVGADDFLTKPFQSIRQLVSKVTALLDVNRRNGEQIQEATANNSFADTLELTESDIADSEKSTDLGDAGMDDEMIQASPISNFALDESAKFETKDYESYDNPEDYKKTQPLSVYDLKEFSFVADEPEKERESQFSEIAQASETGSTEFQNFYEIGAVNEAVAADVEEGANDKTEATDFSENVLTENGIQKQKNEDLVAFLNSLDEDLLEIPLSEEAKLKAAARNNSIVTDSGEQINEVVVGSLIETEENEVEAQAPSLFDSTGQFSAELIDAVARRVVEMLSGEIVREIAREVAREVVMRHMDEAVKKAVEEQLAGEELTK